MQTMDIKHIYLDQMRKERIKFLLNFAHQFGAETDSTKTKDMIAAILKRADDLHVPVYTTGTLDVLNENYGFLRYAATNYASTSEDVFVSGAVIKKFNLKKGDTVHCTIRNPSQNNKHYTLVEVISVNGHSVDEAKSRNDFENLTAVYPSRKIALEVIGHDELKMGKLSLRILDFIAPIGFGQRALIVAPPKTGKTTLMQSIASAISINHPDVHLIVLLVGERPEEVTDMLRSVRGEVISSTFDEPPCQHVHVAEMALAKAKRLAEVGNDVIILMDSLTRLARSNNASLPSSGKVLTGGIDVNALQTPKQFFGAARDLEEGGSLTIIATSLVETGSKADEVVHEEFKGTGNCEVVLDRKSAERRIFPALDVHKSGTRKEELLLDGKTLARVWLLRRRLASMGALEALDLLITQTQKTVDNASFMDSMSTKSG